MTNGSLSMRIFSPLRNSLVSITSAIAALSLARGRAGSTAKIGGRPAALELSRQLRSRDAELVTGPAHVAVRRERQHDEVVRRQWTGDRHQTLRADGHLVGLPHLQRLRGLADLREDAGVLDQQVLQLDAVRRAGLVGLDG